MDSSTATPAPPPSAVRRALDRLASRPRLATTQEIADALGLSTQVVYRHVRDGILPAVRFGRTVRFDAAQVAAFIEEGGTNSPDGPDEDA